MLPKRYQVKSNQQETHDTFTLTLDPIDEPIAPFFPGQFNMLHLFGFGEVPISMSGIDSSNKELVHTIRAIGSVTQGMQQLKKGDEIGVRGPFGTNWPLDEDAEHLFMIAGGLGIAPLRPLLLALTSRSHAFKTVSLLFGARTPSDILFASDLQEWKKKNIYVTTSVDKPDASWKGNVGVITAQIRQSLRSSQTTRILLCGPEIMMKFALIELARAQVPDKQIFLSMERNMKCATGFCGHCQWGPHFLCKDGPIFAYDKIKTYLPIHEL